MRSRKRPALVLLIAVAQILVGVFLLCSGGLCFTCRAAGTSHDTVTIHTGGKTATVVYDTNSEMEREAPGYNVIYFASGAAGLLLAVAMLAGAVGLLKQKAWAWWLTLLWAAAELAFQAGAAVYLWRVAIPAGNRVV